MTKLSVAIVAFNEEAKIADCLDSARFADEIILLDGSSSDQTGAIAKKKGAKVWRVPNDLLMKRMMNKAFDRCSSEWVLSLDADERITPQLALEISRTIAGNPTETAFRFPRKNYIFGKWIEHSFWYPDYQVRLFRKGKARFPAKSVHELLDVDGAIGTLTEGLIHINYETVSEFVLRLDKYTSTEADKLVAQQKKVTWKDAVWFPFSEFLLRFFHEKGYLDGLHGLVLALLQAFYWEVIFAKLWEKEGFWQYGRENFLEEVEQEGKKVTHDLRYWQMVSSRNNVKKLTLKLRNKIMI